MPSEHILIIDDDLIFAQGLGATLELLEYDAPVLIHSGEQALEFLSADRVDLVLMDITLQGGMDGIECAAQVRERFDIPVIFMTAHTDKATLQRARLVHPFGYLIKPFSDRDLHSAIEVALFIHANERMLRASEDVYRARIREMALEHTRELEQANEQLQLQITALASVANAIVITEPDGTITWVNPAFTQLTGYGSDEVLGQNPRLLQSGKQDSDFYQRLWETINSGEVWRGQLLNRRKDGSIYVEEMVITPVKNANGEIRHFVAIKQDISERIAAEKALRESETRYRQVVEHSPILISTWRNQELLFVNQVGAQLMGFANAEEIIGKELSDLVHPDTLQEFIEFFTSDAIRSDCVPKIYEMNATRLDGSRVDLAVSFVVTEPAPHQVVQVIGLDISERKRVQQSLMRQAALAEVELAINEPHELNEVIEQIIQIAAATLSVSGGAGISLIESEAGTVTTRYCERDRPGAIAALSSSMQDPETKEWIAANRKLMLVSDIQRDSFGLGAYSRALKMRAIVMLPLLVEDEVLGSLFVFDRQVREYAAEDIEFLTAIANRSALAIAKVQLYRSLQQAKDSAETVAREKARVLANMSHELRTPLIGIIGLAELLSDTELSKLQSDFVESITAGASKLLELLNNVLDFSRMEEARLALRRQPFEVRKVIDEALAFIAVTASRKNIDLEMLIAPDVPSVIFGDDMRLRQVLTNLLSNAVKFTSSGSIRVEVAVDPASTPIETPQADAVSALLFAVSDTGIGVPAEDIPLLFGAFTQLKSQTASSGGAGLGLAICKQLVELMGGQIWAESAGVDGLGSKFSFTVRAEAALASLPDYIKPEQPALRGKHALVILPKENILKTISEQMRSWEMQVGAFAHAADGLRHLRSNPPVDILLLDPYTPIEEDQAALDQIYALATADGSIPFVLFTDVTLRLNDPMAAAAHHVITYPISTSRLYDILKSILVDAVAAQLPRRAPIAPGEVNEREKTAVLVVDDDSVNRRILRLMLESLDLAVDTASDGFQALQALEMRSYPVVLMDIHMPYMNGPDTSRAIRRQFEDFRQPFIILLTADTQVEIPELLLAAKADDLLVKPFTRHRLREVVERGMANRRDFETHPENEKGAEAAHLDELVLQDLIDTIGVNRRELNEFFEDFYQNSHQLLHKIQLAGSNRDRSSLKANLHALRGSSELFGALHLTRLCKTLENDLNTEEDEAIDGRVEEIVDEYQRVVTLLHQRQVAADAGLEKRSQPSAGAGLEAHDG